MLSDDNINKNELIRLVNKILEVIAKFGWAILDHSPYSLDVAPSDYHLFPVLKKHLG